MRKQLTLEETVKLHRELWNKIADYLESTEFDSQDFTTYFAPMKNRILVEMGYNHVESACFLCEYVKQQGSYEMVTEASKGCYEFCPLFNPSLSEKSCLNGLYYIICDLFYDYKKGYKKYAKSDLIKMAKTIAELPVIERVASRKNLDV